MHPAKARIICPAWSVFTAFNGSQGPKVSACRPWRLIWLDGCPGWSETLLVFVMHRPIWAATWQNQQSECAPSEDSDQPGHPLSLIRVFAVRMKKAWVLSYPLSAQRRLIRLGGCPGWSSLRWAHSHFVGFVMSWFIFFVLRDDNQLALYKCHLFHSCIFSSQGCSYSTARLHCRSSLSTHSNFNISEASWPILIRILFVVSFGLGKGCIQFYGRLDQSLLAMATKSSQTCNGQNDISQ